MRVLVAGDRGYIGAIPWRPLGAAAQLRVYGVGLILGLASVGYVQASTTLMGPFLVILMGMSLVTAPEAADVLRRSPRQLRKLHAHRRRTRGRFTRVGSRPADRTAARAWDLAASRTIAADISARAAGHDRHRGSVRRTRR